MEKALVIIPTYNEAENIKKIIEATIRQNKFDVLVGDDSSPDGTATIVKEIIKAGHTIGISSRGTGSVQQTNEGHLEVQDDFELVCWDFVSNPSTHGAFMNPVSLNEQKGKASIYRNLDIIINDILRA